MSNIYQKNGYEDREDYLRELADMSGIDFSTVSMIADMLGASEDFDSLVTSLEDFEF